VILTGGMLTGSAGWSAEISSVNVHASVDSVNFRPSRDASVGAPPEQTNGGAEPPQRWSAGQAYSTLIRRSSTRNSPSGPLRVTICRRVSPRSRSSTRIARRSMR
jgi:hypothetical protein